MKRKMDLSTYDTIKQFLSHMKFTIWYQAQAQRFLFSGKPFFRISSLFTNHSSQKFIKTFFLTEHNWVKREDASERTSGAFHHHDSWIKVLWLWKPRLKENTAKGIFLDVFIWLKQKQSLWGFEDLGELFCANPVKSDLTDSMTREGWREEPSWPSDFH